MNKERYLDLIRVMFNIGQIFRKDGPQGVERHIENPTSSAHLGHYLSKYPDGARVIETLCDGFKITLSADISTYDLSFIQNDLADDNDIKDIVEFKMLHRFQHCLQQGYPPLVCVEASRMAIPYKDRPTFEEMDKSLMTRNSSLPFAISLPTKSDYLVEYEELLEKRLNSPEDVFEFEDLILLDGHGIKALLAEAKKSVAIVSLYKCERGLLGAISRGLSNRAWDIFVDDLFRFERADIPNEYVKKCRDEVVSIIKRLEKEGKILILRKNKK